MDTAPSWPRLAVAKVVVCMLAVNLYLLFRVRDSIIFWATVAQSLLLAALEVLVHLNVAAVKVLSRARSAPNELYCERRMLRAQAMHELFWSSRTILVLRPSSRAVPFFEPLVADHTPPQAASAAPSFPTRLTCMQSPRPEATPRRAFFAKSMFSRKHEDSDGGIEVISISQRS